MNELHDCQPPTEDRPKTAPTTWPCPDCGAVWRVQVLVESYDFGTRQHTTRATWTRETAVVAAAG